MKNIYFDNGATSRYKPFYAYINFLKLTIKSANSGRSSHIDSITQALAIEETRSLISEKIKDGNVIFTKNCTEALNLAIFGSKLAGEVITTVYEHNSVLRPLKKLEKDGKIFIKYVMPNKDLSYTADIFEKAITPNTKAVVITETSNVIGETLPIEQIGKLCRTKGIRLIVDTAQSLGHTKTNYQNVDIITSSGHKGLCGFQGCGFLIAEKSIRLTPILFGGTGTYGNSLTQPNDSPEGFESGTQSAAIISSLKYGVDFVYQNFDKIKNKIHKLSEYIFTELEKLPQIKLYTQKRVAKNGVISFNIKNFDNSEVANILDSKRISIRSGIMCAPKIMEFLNCTSGVLRISVGYNNSLLQCKKLVKAIKEIIQTEIK